MKVAFLFLLLAILLPSSSYGACFPQSQSPGLLARVLGGRWLPWRYFGLQDCNGVYFYEVENLHSPFFQVWGRLKVYVGMTTRRDCRGLHDRYDEHMTDNINERTQDFDCVYYQAHPCSDRCETTDSYIQEGRIYQLLSRVALPPELAGRPGDHQLYINHPRHVFSDAECITPGPCPNTGPAFSAGVAPQWTCAQSVDFVRNGRLPPSPPSGKRERDDHDHDDPDGDDPSSPKRRSSTRVRTVTKRARDIMMTLPPAKRIQKPISPVFVDFSKKWSLLSAEMKKTVRESLVHHVHSIADEMHKSGKHWLTDFADFGRFDSFIMQELDRVLHPTTSTTSQPPHQVGGTKAIVAPIASVHLR